MIFVTLGTQNRAFTRLLDEIEEQAKKGNIKEEIVVQAGFTKYNSKYMKVVDFFDRDEFREVMERCDLLITHGGVGSILTGLQFNKKIIVCPRLSKYGEHLNDHQVQIVSNFVDKGYILAFNDGDNLGNILKKCKRFKPKRFVSNTNNFISLVDEFISKN